MWGCTSSENEVETFLYQTDGVQMREKKTNH